MKLSKTVWAAAAATALMATALSAQADGKTDQLQRLPIAQKAELEGIAVGIAEAPVRQILGQFVQPALIQLVPPEKREATAKLIDAEVKKYADAAVPAVKASAVKVGVKTLTQVLGDKFSEEELKQLATMLESPIIKRYQAAMPEIQKQLVENIADDARPQVDPKLKALQESSRKILDTASNGKLTQVTAAAQQQATQQQPQGSAPAAPAAKPKGK